MADRSERLHELVQGLMEALGSGHSVAMIVEELSLTGSAGKEIRASVRLSGVVRNDCRALILACDEYKEGMSNLLAVLKRNLIHKKSWSSLERALAAFAPELRGPASSSDDTPEQVYIPSFSGDASPEALQSGQFVEESSLGLSTKTSSQKVYISYAWGDRSPEGQRRGQLAEDLCRAMAEEGITILRDREQIKPGERISAFMRAIMQGDVILVILSNHYLESEYCMYELFGIWKNVSHNPDLFLQRVIPLVLPDAKLCSFDDRFARAEHWLARKRDLETRLSNAFDALGESALAKYQLIKQFSEHTSEMLELLVDKFEPRDFERQAQEGFREVLTQILAVTQG